MLAKPPAFNSSAADRLAASFRAARVPICLQFSKPAAAVACKGRLIQGMAL